MCLPQRAVQMQLGEPLPTFTAEEMEAQKLTQSPVGLGQGQVVTFHLTMPCCLNPVRRFASVTVCEHRNQTRGPEDRTRREQTSGFFQRNLITTLSFIFIYSPVFIKKEGEIF